MKDFFGVYGIIMRYEYVNLFALIFVFFIFGIISFFPIFVRDDEEKQTAWTSMILRRILWGYLILNAFGFYYLAAVVGDSENGLAWAAVLPEGIWYLIYLFAFF